MARVFHFHMSRFPINLITFLSFSFSSILLFLPRPFSTCISIFIIHSFYLHRPLRLHPPPLNTLSPPPPPPPPSCSSSSIFTSIIFEYLYVTRFGLLVIYLLFQNIVVSTLIDIMFVFSSRYSKFHLPVNPVA